MFDTTEPKDVYLPDHIYHAMKDKLAKMIAEPCEKGVADPDTEVVRALGEIGGIWPRSVLDDEDRD